MTNRLTNGDRKSQAETPETPDFSRYKVCDSYSVPATDSPTADGAPDTGSHSPQRVSRKQLQGLDSRLGERDRELLGAIQKYRYLMTGQVQRLLFTDAANSSAGLRAASRNLKKLRGLGLVDSLSRRIGGVRAGSGSLIWYLTHAGERLLRLYDERAYPARRHFEPSAYFLAHTLAVAETAIRLIEVCRKHEPEILSLQLEPECWRAYSNAGASCSLKPDLYAATVTEEYEDRYFIEVDLDTESPAKIIEKCQKYHAYYRSGLEQEESEMFPLTVWIVPSVTRKEKLIRQLKGVFDKQPKLFAVITGDDLEHLILEGGDREMLC
ncbi:replication-relaxation family protein [Mediterraneibacter agrestimuris]|uniref:replication-relaxation family protein n=1 Tax=Mediterraneibacter agrestimuris TaxID=2941333 RepID=UPI00203CEAC1|nr:replication-relaxation family protein [Mediterraneibacter agrestimuris]